MARKPITSETHFGKNELFRMARDEVQKNLFNIKHPATIAEYTKPSTSFEIEGNTPLVTHGLNIETNEAGEVKLISLLCENGNHSYFQVAEEHTPNDVLEWFACCLNKKFLEKHNCLVSTTQLHGVHLLQLMMKAKGLSLEEQMLVLQRWSGGIEGVFSKGEWVTEPLISMEITCKKKNKLAYNEDCLCWDHMQEEYKVEFGISQAINGSVCFYILPPNGKKLQRLWLFDMSRIYADPEKAAMENRIEYKLFEEKPDFSEVDWKRTENDFNYFYDLVTHSNEKAKLAKGLADFTSHAFAEVFKIHTKEGIVRRYPKGLFSTGILSVFALSSLIRKYDDFKSINWVEQMKEWLENDPKHTQEDVLETFLMSIEGYKAGLIEAFQIGTATKRDHIWTADIGSAYPFIMRNLYDFRGSTITRGTGKPQKPHKHSYVYCRAIARNVGMRGFHTVGVKEPRYENMVVRPSGEFKATALYQEWDLLERQGAEVEYLEWVEIRTKGQKHPLSFAVEKLWKLRMQYRAAGNDAMENVIKLVMNSIYGKLFEAIKKHEETEEHIICKGYKAGQLFSPIVAGVICSYTRIRMVETLLKIKENGGEPVMALTDSITWNGKKEALPERFESVLAGYGDHLTYNGYSSVKSEGWGLFDEPKPCHDFVCLGAGRYYYVNEDGEQVMKNRGMILNFLDNAKEATEYNDGKKDLETFHHMMKKAIANGYKVPKDKPHAGQECLKAKQRVIATPEYCLHKLDPSKLGQVVTETVEMVVHNVFPKRTAIAQELHLKIFQKKLVDTWATPADSFAETQSEMLDGTLPALRERIKELGVIAYATEAIKEDRKKGGEQAMEKKRTDEMRSLREFFGMSNDRFKAWRSSVKDQGGITFIREEARKKGWVYDEAERA